MTIISENTKEITKLFQRSAKSARPLKSNVMSEDMTNDLPCPSCGFLTCEENYGNYSICEICGWEDDGVQLANPCSGGGANGESLAEAQVKSLTEYPLSVEIAEGIKRSPKWRPLSEHEI